MSAKEGQKTAKSASRKQRSPKHITRQRLGHSVGSWLRGLSAGTMDKKLGHYYDHVDSFEGLDTQFAKDPRRMTKIQKLETLNKIEEFLKQAHETRETTKPKGNT